MSDSPSNPTDSRRISTRQKNNKALQAVEQAASSKQAASSSSSGVHGVSNSNKRKSTESTFPGTNDDDHVTSKKAVRKLSEKSPNETSKYFCHGCNKNFPEFKSNREFINST